MKIIFCLHHFLPDFIAGTEIYTLRLAQHLNELGNEVVILIPHFDHHLTSEYQYEKLRVVRYGEWGISSRKIIMGTQKPVGLEGFVNILKIEKPDIIHFHEVTNGRGISLFHVKKAKDLGIPIILTCHLSYYSCHKGTLIYKDLKKCDGEIKVKRCTECMYDSKKIVGLKAKLLLMVSSLFFKIGINTIKLDFTIATALGYQFVIKKVKLDLLRLSEMTEKIIVLGDWYKKILVINGVPAQKIIYIPQGLTNNIQIQPKESKVTLPLKLVFIGRISAFKGLHLLIEALGQLPENQVSLDIYGPNTDDSYAVQCQENSLLNKNIHWKEPLESFKVINRLSQYDLLCLPSTFSEMSPLVIQEAFAAGIPVIASNVYGNAAQIIDGTTGWLFKFKDSYDLAKLIKRLIACPSLIEEARGKLPKANLFTKVAQEHILLYSNIIK